MDQANLTQRQQKWFATLRAGLERDTGKTMDQWIAIALTCPETRHRARLAWLKKHHGLLQNRASQVVSEAYPSLKGWSEPDALLAALWTDASARTIYEAVDALSLALPDVMRTARKGYTAWSRTLQFAAMKPARDGGVLLGLALDPASDARLEPPRSRSWSERLKAEFLLTSIDDVNPALTDLLRTAWRGS